MKKVVKLLSLALVVGAAVYAYKKTKKATA
jgi:hypothetical protein